MSRHISWAFLAVSCCAIVSACLAPTVRAGGWGNVGKASTDMEKLAVHINRLEKHLDNFGTIVPKSPDVWGEARLTRHRQQVERELENQLSSFKFVLNGALSRSDSSFLASATVIEAMNGKPNFPDPPATTSVAAVSALIPSIDDSSSEILARNKTTLIAAVPEGGSRTNGTTTVNIGIEPTIYLDQMNRYLSHLNELRRLNEGDDNTDTPGYALHLVRIPVSILPGKHTRTGYGAEINCTVEPVMGDELLPKTFRDLVINDLVDLGGLPLTKVLENQTNHELFAEWIKLPESAFNAYVSEATPGPTTPGDQGKSPTPNSQNALFKANKRVLVTGKNRDYLNDDLAHAAQMIESVSDDGDAKVQEKQVELNAVVSAAVLKIFIADAASGATSRRDKLGLSPTMLLDRSVAASIRDIARLSYDFSRMLNDPINRVDKQRRVEHPKMLDIHRVLRVELSAAYDFLEQPGAACLWQFAGPDLARAIRERRRYILDPNVNQNLLDEFDVNAMALKEVYQHQDSTTGSLVNVQQKFPVNIEYYRRNFFNTIAQQFPQVYDTTTATLAWWILVESSLLNEQLVEDMHTFASHKNAPITDAGWMAYYGPNPMPEARAAFNTYVKCRWPIHVFALDPVSQDQNISDEHRRRTEMQIVMALALGGQNGPTNPIRAQSMLRFVRRLERDMATIDVRRTVIAFTHGEDNFGWQFRPRFQSPETPSNAQVILRDSLIGGPSEERLLADEQLEPGTRECTALIVMPSFVPYARIHTRANWFKLSHKTKKAPFLPPAIAQRDPDIVDAIRLSEEITDLRSLSASCLKNANDYRDGEAYRLVNTVKQLDAKLPTQTHYFQVPYENTLGGFDMFNTGITDLAPRINGFYGAPGINHIGNSSQFLLLAQDIENAKSKLVAAIAALQADPTTPANKVAVDTARSELSTAQSKLAALADSPGTTSLFIVGQNLSVHGTRVIAGGVDVTESMKLLSRQQMQVYIPPTVNVFPTNGNAENSQRVIDLHIATPYGVSNHLLIPVNDPILPAPPSPDVSDAVKKAIKAEVAEANLSLLSNMGMHYEWSNTCELRALIDSEKVVKLGDSTPLNLEITRKGQQIGLFNDGGAEIAFFVTELDAEGKPVPTKVTRTKPVVLAAAADPFNSPGNSVLSLSKEKLEQILAEGINQKVFSELPKAIQLQGFIRFKSDGAPVIKLNNQVTVKIFEKVETEQATANGLFRNPEITPFDNPGSTFTDRYRVRQQATIIPPQVVQ